LLEDAFRVLAGRKMSNSSKQSIYKNGFFIGAGVFAGIALNDLFRLSGSDINYKKAIIAGPEGPEPRETRVDEVLQYAIVLSITALSIVTGKYVKEVIPMSAGALTGITWSNLSERGGKPISLMPF
jgi:hypothetical protein